MPNSRPGDMLASRYRLDDLMSESDRGRFWRGYDTILARTVSVHTLLTEDPRAESLLAAAQASARLSESHLLRVLDIDSRGGMTFVVNEWGSGTSVDHLLAVRGPLSARSAAWLVGEVAAALTVAHEAGVAHGRLSPENVLIDDAGSVRIIGFAVEAALHGLPPGRTEVDIVDLAGLLEATLTGRWAGISDSAVPRVPHEQGGLLDRDRDHLLTPRQLQPGVPGVLDELCHEVLNRPHGRHAGRHTAREIHDVLAAFVGDPTDLHDTALELSGAGHPSSQGTAQPAPAIRQAGTAAPAIDIERTGPLGLSDLPTQEGTPIFGEDDEVEWFDPRTARTTVPPPTPEPLSARPLFAPTNEPRQPRPTASDSGSGGSGESRDWIFSAPNGVEEDTPESGRLLRFGLVVGVVMTLLVTALVLVYVLNQDQSDPETDSPSQSPTVATPAVIRGVTALDFDPSGTPPTENRDLAPLAVDGDPATSWRSSTYYQQFGPKGLKSGLGMILDLHKQYTVTSLDLTFVNPGTTVEVFVTDTSPTSVDGLERVASMTASTTADVTLVTPTRGRFVTLWFTGLPQVRGGYRVQLAEAVVKGTAS